MEYQECPIKVEGADVDNIRPVMSPLWSVKSDKTKAVKCTNGKFFVREGQVLVIDIDGKGTLLDEEKFDVAFRHATEKDVECWHELVAYKGHEFMEYMSEDLRDIREVMREAAEGQVGKEEATEEIGEEEGTDY